jgi:hypothetical protein
MRICDKILLFFVMNGVLFCVDRLGDGSISNENVDDLKLR